MIPLLRLCLMFACLPMIAFGSAQPRNLFAELLGKSRAETDARIESVWRQYTEGDAENERIYFEAPDNTAYIANVGSKDVRSEGQSYGMMIAVMLDRRDQFDRLWKWTRTHMRHESGPRAGYFAWQCAYDGTIMDPTSASDGEVWIVTALFFAAHRWGDGEGIFAYSREAQSLLRAMRHQPRDGLHTAIFDAETKLVTFCPIGGAATFTDASYNIPAFYELWARWATDADDRRFWSEAAVASRAFLRRHAHPVTGLMSEYAHFDGRPYAEEKGRDHFAFDAWRTPAFVALDRAWGGGDPWVSEQTDRVLRFFAAQGDNLVNRYTLDGQPKSSTKSPGMIAMAAAAGLGASDPELARPFVRQLWDTPAPRGKWRYYDGLLTVLGLLQAGGRFVAFEPGATASAAALNSDAQVTDKRVAFDSFAYAGSDPTPDTPLAPGQYRNPILAGFFPDPSICRVGEDYYLVNSTFGYFPGLPVFHSRDLVNWRLIGHGISRPDQLNYRGVGVSQGLFAPAIEHHDGVFYLVCTMIGGRGNFVITATDPAGPWSDPHWLDFSGIDPSLFFDDDGRAWLVHNGEPPDNKPLYDGHRAVWLREFDPVAKRIVGEPRLLVNGGVDLAQKPVWIEGPHLYKRDGWYYLTCAEGGTGTWHSQVVLRSRAVTGPFEPWSENPILTQRDLDGSAPGSVTCTGHADLVKGPDGRWWSVFLGCRPYSEGRYFTTGRETFLLPVDWPAGGWPRILPPGQRVPLVLPSPRGVSPAPGLTILSGALDWRDDFSAPALDPLWIGLRAPAEAPLWTLDHTAGKLLLQPVAEPLAGKQHPAFLARRVQHARFRAEAGLALPPMPGVRAGLALFQAEKNHYFLAIERQAGGGAKIVVELADRAAPRVIHEAVLPAPAATEAIGLRLTADADRLVLSWSVAPGEWTDFVAPAGTRPVTNEAAGGGIHFTGAVVGLHARADLP